MIIAERGFVFVGRVHREADKVVIEDAYNVRRFSQETKDGIGGLAIRSPKKDNDILDPCPTARIFVLAVVAEMECPDQGKWIKWHAGNAKKAR